jgi:hypothetical protein
MDADFTMFKARFKAAPDSSQNLRLELAALASSRFLNFVTLSTQDLSAMQADCSSPIILSRLAAILLASIFVNNL